MSEARKLPAASEQLPDIDSKRVDTAAAIAKGIFGAAPVVGSMVAEVIGVLIPNQRIDRITRFLQILENRVSTIEREKLQAKMGDEQFVDLLEDGLWQATRSLSEERRGYIASLLKNSISKEDLSHTEEKRLLDILGQLSDPEIIILQSYVGFFAERREFHEKHEAVLSATRVTMGSSEGELERAAIHSTFRPRLTSLGLLRPRFRKPSVNQSPQFDEDTGMMKATGYEVTPLGSLLLQYLDLPTGRSL